MTKPWAGDSVRANHYEAASAFSPGIVPARLTDDGER